MEYCIKKSIEILERTPKVLHAILFNLCDELAKTNEGKGTWSPFEVLAHLIQMDRCNWMERILMILSNHPNKTFKAFDRQRQFDFAQGKSINELITKFENVRKQSLLKLQELDLDESGLHFETGFHPDFGEVKLHEIITTWAAHDLTHIHQITRVLSKVYKDTVVLALLD